MTVSPYLVATDTGQASMSMILNVECSIDGTALPAVSQSTTGLSNKHATAIAAPVMPPNSGEIIP